LISTSTPAADPFHQRIDRLVGRVDDVHQPLVGSNLELIARVLFTCGERSTS